MQTAEQNNKSAEEWFAKSRASNLTEEEQSAFKIWLQEGKNACAFEELEGLWGAAGSFSEDADLLAALDAALQPHPQMPREETLYQKICSLWSKWLVPSPAFAYAVIFMLMIGSGATFFLNDRGDIYVTQIGEQRIFMLEDGSAITLNTGSRVKVSYDKEYRRLTLEEGQAVFDVAHDMGRPFIVQAGTGRVKALGTKFDIHKSEKNVIVTLLEGKVSVTQNSLKTLNAGEQITYTRGQGFQNKRKVDIETESSWTTGVLIFKEMTLIDTVKELNRYTKSKVRITNPEIAKLRVNGVFHIDNVDAIYKTLEKILPIQLNADEDGQIIQKKS